MHGATFLIALLTVVGVSDSRPTQFEEAPRGLNQGVTTNESPFIGNWVAEPSQPSGLPTFKRATVQFDLDDDTVTITRRFVRGLWQDKGERGDRVMYQTDGEEHPRGPTAVYAATWRGSRVLTIVAKSDGQVLGQRTFEVSADGQLLTVTTSSWDANGTDTESAIILHRQ